MHRTNIAASLTSEPIQYSHIKSENYNADKTKLQISWFQIWSSEFDPLSPNSSICTSAETAGRWLEHYACCWCLYACAAALLTNQLMFDTYIPTVTGWVPPGCQAACGVDTSSSVNERLCQLLKCFMVAEANNQMEICCYCLRNEIRFRKFIICALCNWPLNLFKTVKHWWFCWKQFYFSINIVYYTIVYYYIFYQFWILFLYFHFNFSSSFSNFVVCLSFLSFLIA